MDWQEAPMPSHRCKVCGALWRFWRQEETPFAKGDSWSCHSTAFGKCCDMAPMGGQIEPLSCGEALKWLSARVAVDAMHQHLLGPKPDDSVN